MTEQALIIHGDYAPHHDKARRFRQLMEEIPRMEEFRLTQLIDNLLTSLRVFTLNYAELRQALTVITSEEVALLMMDQGHRNEADAILKDIVRLLHNYVAAAKTLVDHTRRLYNKLYQASNQFPDYQARVKSDFTNDPLSVFIQDLRNYFLHYDVPALTFEVKLTAGRMGVEPTFTRTALLQTQSLLGYDWKPKAREYFDNKERVDLLEVVVNYGDKVQRFYDWFHERQQAIHAEELRKLNSKKRESFLIWLEWATDSALQNMESVGLFHGLLQNSQWHDVDAQGSDRAARAYRITALLGRQHSIPGRLKRRIIELCLMPNFRTPTRFAPHPGRTPNTPVILLPSPAHQLGSIPPAAPLSRQQRRQHERRSRKKARR